MKKTYIYIIIVLFIFISTFIINTIVNNNRIDSIYESLVYIESSDEETIKSGSGFVYKTEKNKNYIITNYHVIEGYDDIYVYNTNKKKAKASIINYDQENDIALISINNDLGLKKITLGNSDKVKIGEDVFVVGTPLNIDYISTLSKGSISYIDRKITIKTSYGFNSFSAIQIDARVEEGNSGGPVLNKLGKVIGMMFVKEKNIDGIGFALPINFVMDVVENLERSI